MKKILAVVALAAVVVGSLSMAKPAPKRLSDAEVNAVVDARLHELLARMNAQRAHR